MPPQPEPASTPRLQDDEAIHAYAVGQLPKSGIPVDELTSLARSLRDVHQPTVLLGFNDCAKHLVNLSEGTRVRGGPLVRAIVDLDPAKHGWSFRGVPVLSFDDGLALGPGHVVVTSERDNYLFTEALFTTHQDDPSRTRTLYPNTRDGKYRFDPLRHLPQYRFLEDDRALGMGMTPDRILFLLEALRQTLHLPGDVLEVGVYQCGSAWHLGQMLRQVAPDKTLFLYDMFEECPPDQPQGVMCLDELRDAIDYPKVEFHSGDLDGKGAAIRDRRYCFVHYDLGMHEESLEASLEALVPGGILLLDNYGVLVPPLAPLFTTWLRDRGLEVASVPGSTQAWVIKPPDMAAGTTTHDVPMVPLAERERLRARLRLSRTRHQRTLTQLRNTREEAELAAKKVATAHAERDAARARADELERQLTATRSQSVTKFVRQRLKQRRSNRA